MKQIIACWLSNCLACLSASSQSNSLVNMPYAGICVYSHQQHDVFGFTRNQAALAGAKHPSVGVYTERRYMLQENTQYLLAAEYPSRIGNIGLAIQLAGFSLYRENSIGLAYARNLGSKLDIGIQASYFGRHIPSYSSESTVFAQLGLIMHLTGKLDVGLHFYNPGLRSRKNDRSPEPESQYSFGIGYDASDQFFISMDLMSKGAGPVSMSGGFQYRFMHRFFARAGIITSTGSCYIGSGVSIKKMRLDISVSLHPQLGISPGVLLLYDLKNLEG